MKRTWTAFFTLVLAFGLLAAPAALAQDDGAPPDDGQAARPDDAAKKDVDDPDAAPAEGDDRGDADAATDDEKPCPLGDVHEKHRGSGHAQKSLQGAVSLLAGVSVIALGGLSLFAFLLLIAIAFPTSVTKVREGMEARPWVSLGLGAVNSVFVLLLLGALAHAGGPGAVMGTLILLAFLMMAVFGLSGRAQNLGARAMVLADRKPNTVANLAIGWWVIYLVGIIPIVGWVLFAYWATAGIGSVLVSVFSRGKQEAKPPESGGIEISGPNYTV
jgi:hypothetical protein